MENKRVILGVFALFLLSALSVSFYNQKYKKLVSDPAAAEGDDDHHTSSTAADYAADGSEAISKSHEPRNEADAISQVMSDPTSQAAFAVMSEAMASNNPEVLKLIAQQDPKLATTYGEGGWSLLHIASYQCSPEIVKALHSSGKLNWDLKAKDGTTPLTIAAESDCLPVLKYWKDHQAAFNKADGRGKSALSILKTKESSAELASLVSSLEGRKPASAQVAETTFYRKRKFDDSVPNNQRKYVDPNVRPDEIPETAEFTEFAD
jgi:hypothetical protein